MQFLRDFFHAGGDSKGVPLDVLQNRKYNDLLRVRIYYDWTTDSLMEVYRLACDDCLSTHTVRRSVSVTSSHLYDQEGAKAGSLVRLCCRKETWVLYGREAD